MKVKPTKKQKQVESNVIGKGDDGKNSMPKKGMFIQDQLYDEILNGFNSEELNEGKVDEETSYILTTTQRKRIAVVGLSFLSGDFTKNFLSKNVQIIIDKAKTLQMYHLNRILNLYNQIRDKDDEEKDEIDELEEEKDDGDKFSLKKLNDSIEGVSKVLRFANRVKGVYKTIAELTAERKQTKPYDNSKNSQYQQKLNKHLSVMTVKIEDLINKTLPPTLQSIPSLYEMGIFDKFWDAIITFILGDKVERGLWLAGKVITWVVPKVRAGVELAEKAKIALNVQRLVTGMKKAYKVAKLIHKGINASLFIADIIEWTPEDEAKLEKFIEEKLTIPVFIPTAQKVKKNIQNQTDEFQERVNQRLQDVELIVGGKNGGILGSTNEALSEYNKLTGKNQNQQSDEITESEMIYDTVIKIVPIPKSNVPNVLIKHREKEHSLTLERIYNISMSDKSREVIRKSPAVRYMKMYVGNLETFVTLIIQKEYEFIKGYESILLKASQSLSLDNIDDNTGYNKKEFIKMYQRIQQVYDQIFDNKILRDLNLNSFGVSDKMKQQIKETEFGNFTLTENSIDEIVTTSSGRIITENGQKVRINDGWVLNAQSQEEVRPLFTSKYGYLSGIMVDVVSSKEKFPFNNNSIYFHKPDGFHYDVVYVSEKNMQGYMSKFEIEEVKNGDWQPNSTKTTVQEYGYIGLIETLFNYNLLRNNELKKETEICDNLDKILDEIANGFIKFGIQINFK